MLIVGLHAQKGVTVGGRIDPLEIPTLAIFTRRCEVETLDEKEADHDENGKPIFRAKGEGAWTVDVEKAEKRDQRPVFRRIGDDWTARDSEACRDKDGKPIRFKIGKKTSAPLGPQPWQYSARLTPCEIGQTGRRRHAVGPARLCSWRRGNDQRSPTDHGALVRCSATTAISRWERRCDTGTRRGSTNGVGRVGSSRNHGGARLFPALTLPVHLDLFSQTEPRFATDPDPAPFLHGPTASPADVNIVWRADLDPEQSVSWKDDKLSRETPLRVEPTNDGEAWLVFSKRRFRSEAIELAEGDQASHVSGHPVLLEPHLCQVERLVTHHTQALRLCAGFADALCHAARFHDYGKADARFQEMLYGSAVEAAAGGLRAKSGYRLSHASRIAEAAKSAKLPEGFRHELLTLDLIEAAKVIDVDLRELILHLIATHHGYCRCLARNCEDIYPPEVSVPIEGRPVVIADRTKWTAIDSGIASRFWALTNKHGWFGLAFLETLIRLADHVASAEPKTDE